jgi:hypothetical protein
MNRSWRTRLVTAAVAALTLAAPPAPARAETTQWVTVRCATGAMKADLSSDGIFTVSGWIQPCSLNTIVLDEARFRIAYYGPLSAAGGELLAYTGGQTAPTEFSRSLDTAQLSEPLRAACLVYSPNPRYGRVACVGISLGEESGIPEVVPIPVDDLLTTFPVHDPVTDHFCATCV